MIRNLTKFRAPTGSAKEKVNSSFQTGLRQLFITLVFSIWEGGKTKNKANNNNKLLTNLDELTLYQAD